VLGVHDLRTRKTGDMLLVDVHLEIDGDLSVRQGHEIAEAVQARVLERHPVRMLSLFSAQNVLRGRVFLLTSGQLFRTIISSME
jgi:hypothetical protein